MKTYRILIYIDNKIRDLPRLVLLKTLLEDQYGHEVELITTLANPTQVAQRWQPHLMVFHHLRNYKILPIADRLRRAGIALAVLSDEFTYGNLDETDRQFMANIVDIDRVDLHFSGHPEEKTVLEARTGRPLDNVHYIGNLNFDFYGEPFRQLLTPREEFYPQHGLNTAFPTVLVVTSFPHGHVDPDTFDYERLQRRTPLSQTRDWRAMLADHKRNKELMIEAVVQIAKRWPDLNIILRPHPFEAILPEAMAMYDHHFTKSGVREHINYVPEGHLSHLLNQADFVLQPWSTSSLEAGLMDLPTISLSTAEFKDPTHLIFNHVLKGGDHVHTAAAAVKALDRYLNGGAFPPEVQEARDNLLVTYLPYPPGQITQQAARLVDDFLRRKKPRPRFNRLYGKRKNRFIYTLRRLVRRGLSRSLDSTWDGWIPPSERVASQEEIDLLAARIRAALSSIIC